MYCHLFAVQLKIVSNIANKSNEKSGVQFLTKMRNGKKKLNN